MFQVAASTPLPSRFWASPPRSSHPHHDDQLQAPPTDSPRVCSSKPYPYLSPTVHWHHLRTPPKQAHHHERIGFLSPPLAPPPRAAISHPSRPITLSIIHAMPAFSRPAAVQHTHTHTHTARNQKTHTPRRSGGTLREETGAFAAAGSGQCTPPHLFRIRASGRAKA